MFTRVLALLPLVFLASASHLEARGTCNNGSIQCCNSVQSYQQLINNPKYSQWDAELAAIGADANAPIGVSCSPITGIGLGNGNSCTQQTVCCNGNNFNGLIVVGCSPINVNL